MAENFQETARKNRVAALRRKLKRNSPEAQAERQESIDRANRVLNKDKPATATRTQNKGRGTGDRRALEAELGIRRERQTTDSNN